MKFLSCTQPAQVMRCPRNSHLCHQSSLRAPHKTFHPFFTFEPLRQEHDRKAPGEALVLVPLAALARERCPPSPWSAQGCAVLWTNRPLCLFSGYRWPLREPIRQTGTPRLGRGRGQSWVPMISHETTEVAKAVVEPAGPNPTPVLSLFSPKCCPSRSPGGRHTHMQPTPGGVAQA